MNPTWIPNRGQLLELSPFAHEVHLRALENCTLGSLTGLALRANLAARLRWHAVRSLLKERTHFGSTATEVFGRVQPHLPNQPAVFRLFCKPSLICRSRMHSHSATPLQTSRTPA